MWRTRYSAHTYYIAQNKLDSQPQRSSHTDIMQIWFGSSFQKFIFFSLSQIEFQVTMTSRRGWPKERKEGKKMAWKINFHDTFHIWMFLFSLSGCWSVDTVPKCTTLIRIQWLTTTWINCVMILFGRMFRVCARVPILTLFGQFSATRVCIERTRASSGSHMNHTQSERETYS